MSDEQETLEAEPFKIQCPECSALGQKVVGWDYEKSPIEEIIEICSVCGGDGWLS